jgi:hypothetical protein
MPSTGNFHMSEEEINQVPEETTEVVESVERDEIEVDEAGELSGEFCNNFCALKFF